MYLGLLRTAAIAIALCWQTYLSAEIQQAIIRWTPMLCWDECVRLLQKQLGDIPGVAEVNINQGSGQAILRWKPNAPFSFIPINTAMRVVGPDIIDLRVRIRGRLKHDNKFFSLISLGDDTPFILLGPAVPNPTGYTQEFNIQAHPLSHDMWQQLLDAEESHQIAIVEGPLFQPERSPPLTVIIQRLTFEGPPSTTTPR